MIRIARDANRNVKMMFSPRQRAHTLLRIQEKESPEKYAVRQNSA